MIVAGEASGDMHAATLVRAIKKIYPSVDFFGLGGKRLKEEGVSIHFDLVDMAVIGIFEVLKNIFKFKRIFSEILAETEKTPPDLAILVDYPGFNLRLARALHKRNIPVIYYISPQVWAWGAERIGLIKRVVSRMMVFFKFEEELYRKNNIPVSWVGSPLLDTVKPEIGKAELFSRLKLAPGKKTFALLPGSREKEVKTLLPIMLETCKLIYERFEGNAQFLILASPSVNKDTFEAITKNYALPLCLAFDLTYDGLSASDFALVASGTATLETAILGTPMVILYKVSFPTWAYLKMHIKIPYIGLVNVVKQERLIAEFIQYDARPEKIADYICGVFCDEQKMDKIRNGLSGIKELLGEKGATLKAAQVVVDFLKKNTG